MLACNEFFKQSNRHAHLHISLLTELKSIRILRDYKHCTPDGVGQRASVQKVSDIGHPACRQDVCASFPPINLRHYKLFGIPLALGRGFG